MQKSMHFEDSGISGLFAKMEEHDTGATAVYRGGGRFTAKQNQERTGELVSKLTAKGYRVTSVKGSYIRNVNTTEATEVTQRLLFVEDYQDRGTLKTDLIELGESFEQESILFIPRLNSDGESIPVPVGTNNAAFPGRGKEVPFADGPAAKC